ncbi:hypothetical protein DFH11DRAFT_1808329 [Phellopilus nigrolimitatus]|nr:hypothetical protein DFH11DRAFT_1808329 [Phellopilus nigrolimitatus]
MAENAQHYGGSAKTQTAIFFTQPSSQPSSIEEGISRRFFLDRTNKCSVEEVVNLCVALNRCIDTLVLNVLDEWDKVPVKDDAPVGFDVPTIIVAGRDIPLELNIANLVRKALGKGLYRSITGLKPEDSELEAYVHDALQVWATFCIHLAMKPLLFGFKVRTMSDVKEAFHQMVKHETDNAQTWKTIWADNTSPTAARNLKSETSFQIFPLYPIRLLKILMSIVFWKKHTNRSSGAEVTGVHTDNGSQAIALHWRALLHSHPLSNSPTATSARSHSDSSPSLALGVSASPSPPSSPNAFNGWPSLDTVISKSHIDGAQVLRSVKRYSPLGFIAKVLPSEQPTAQLHPKGEEGEEILRLVFLDKANKCSEAEVIDLCTALNGHIDNLVVDVQDEWDKMQDKACKRDEPRHTLGVFPSVVSRNDVLLSDKGIAELVRAALGSEIYETLTNPATEAPDIDAVVQDALQAWATFCVYLAITPLLFGFKLRTQKDVEEAIRRMKIHEPEIAKVWNRLRKKNIPATKYDPSRIRDFDKYIFCLPNTTPKDFDSYRHLEETYQKMLCHEESQAVALHWRALLHTYDRKLGSFNVAFKQTQEVLCEGLLEVFALAGRNPPLPFLDNIRALTAKNRVIEEASQLAETIVTGCFGANVEVFVVDPGSPYDRESMMLNDQDHTAEAVVIKCTIGLGLREIVPRTGVLETERPKRVLLKTNVLSSACPVFEQEETSAVVSSSVAPFQ